MRADSGWHRRPTRDLCRHRLRANELVDLFVLLLLLSVVFLLYYSERLFRLLSLLRACYVVRARHTHRTADAASLARQLAFYGVREICGFALSSATLLRAEARVDVALHLIHALVELPQNVNYC